MLATNSNCLEFWLYKRRDGSFVENILFKYFGTVMWFVGKQLDRRKQKLFGKDPNKF